MSSHPDADAFIRAFLRTPPDTTTRLAFADWLDEYETPSCRAWAAYLRLKVEADRHPPGSAGQREREATAAALAPAIRARLTVPAKLFVDNPRSLLQLLPGPNINVRLDALEVPPPVYELMPESVARENVVVPLDLQGPLLLVAAIDPTDPDLVQKLEFILNKDVIAVRGGVDDIVATINRRYGQTETESVDSVLYESPQIALLGDAESSALFGVFHTARSRRMTGFEMGLTPAGTHIRYLRGDDPALDDTQPATVYHRLRKHLLSLKADRSYSANGLRCRDVHIPLLSGRPFPVTVERERGWRPRKWFRVRFRR